MKANSGKSHLLSNCSKPSTALIDDSSIESNTKETLLGIKIDGDLKFDDHANAINRWPLIFYANTSQDSNLGKPLVFLSIPCHEPRFPGNGKILRALQNICYGFWLFLFISQLYSRNHHFSYSLFNWN